jgi:hypothetical protein
MLESKFKTDERERFEKLGWKFITLSAGGGVPKGFPDTLCLAPNGYTCYVEWKKSKGAKKQSLQPYWHQKLKEMGHDAFFVYPENVNEWRAEVLRKGGHNG